MFLRNFDDTKSFFYDISHVLMKAISEIKSNVVGLDRISIKVIRLALPVILPELLYIDNYFLQVGSFSSI